MKYIFSALFCLLIIFSSSCGEDYRDPLGDLIVNLKQVNNIPNNPLINTQELGIFPSESLLTNEFTADLAFKTATADTEEERVIFTNILPGTYVVAFIANSTDINVPLQVVQITADDVTVADLYY